MKCKYKGFTIERNKIIVYYKEKESEATHYVVYKEIDGEKVFLSGTTAFDSLEKAKEKIDLICK